MRPEDLQKKLESLHEQYRNLDVTQKASWPVALASCLARYKRSNLAIVGIVALAALEAYKPLPLSVMLAAVLSVALLGRFGGLRE